MGPEGIILILLALGGAALLIIKNKADLPDPNEMKENRSGRSREVDELSSSLSNSLNELSKSNSKSKRDAKKRKDFIRKHYKIIASFYNNYKFIDYTKKTNQKIAKKQMLDIVKVLDRNLEIMEDFFSQDDTNSNHPVDYQIMLVGIITFKLMKKETFNKVNLDLKKLYHLGEQSDFPMELMTAIERVLTPLGYFD
jgi:hypothetical protein